MRRCINTIAAIKRIQSQFAENHPMSKPPKSGAFCPAAGFEFSCADDSVGLTIGSDRNRRIRACHASSLRQDPLLLGPVRESGALCERADGSLWPSVFDTMTHGIIVIAAITAA